MRVLQQSEITQVAGAALNVDVNVPSQFVKLTFGLFNNTVKLPFLTVDWGKIAADFKAKFSKAPAASA
jgi:hypothetical protein